MIKRVRFATRARDLTVEAFAIAWPDAVAAVAEAPPPVRPVRVAVCTTMPELSGPDPLHDGLALEWFADAAHVARYEAWLLTNEGRSSQSAMDRLLVHAASPVILTRESVVRGADWLGPRWQDGGQKLKHLAIALRASGLSAAEFSERWANHGGRLEGSDGAAVVIPDEVRGLAYVQNHPCPRLTGDWPYDALNEVWFDTPAGLRARVDWFRANLADHRGDDLVRRSWFLAAREDVVLA